MKIYETKHNYFLVWITILASSVCSVLNPKEFLLCFSLCFLFFSIFFSFLHFTLKSMIHCDLNFEWNIEFKIKFYFCFCFVHGYPIAPAPFVGKAIFPPAKSLCTYIKIQLDLFVWSYFLVLYTVPLIYMSVRPPPTPHIPSLSSYVMSSNWVD